MRLFGMHIKHLHLIPTRPNTRTVILRCHEKFSGKSVHVDVCSSIMSYVFYRTTMMTKTMKTMMTNLTVRAARQKIAVIQTQTNKLRPLKGGAVRDTPPDNIPPWIQGGSSSCEHTACGKASLSRSRSLSSQREIQDSEELRLFSLNMSTSQT